jgi:hypothetical protein
MNNKFYVEYKQYDASAIADSTATSSSNVSFGNLALIKDNYKPDDYMTLEEDFTLLDGSFSELPDSPTDVVFWSDLISDADGNFSTNPSLIISFGSNHSSVGLTLHFSDEYPLEMIITWYTSTDQIITSETYVIDNSSFFVSKKVDNYKKIKIEFTKAMPYRFVKMWYVEYGRIFIIDETIVKSAQIVRECSPTSDKISVDSMSVVFMDKNNDFNLANGGGLHSTIQRNQVLEPYRVMDNGTPVKQGEFYIDKYDIVNNTVTFSCVDKIGLMDNVDFTHGQIYVNVSAGSILDATFLQSGIDDYIIDSETSATLLSGTLKKQSCRKALREVLFACNSIMETHNGIVTIKKQSKVTQSTVGRNRKFLTVNTKNEYVSDISISYTKYALNSAIVQILAQRYSAGTHTIYFATPVSALTTNVGTITEQSAYYCILTLSVESDIIISGKRYDSTEINTVYSVNEIPAGENKNVKNFTSTLTDGTIGSDKAKALLEYYQMGLSVNASFVLESEKTGNFAIIENPSKDYSDYIAGFEKMTIDCIGFKANSTLRGYYQQFTEEMYCGEFYCGEWGLI